MIMKHPYHLVSISPWPLLVSFEILNLALNLITSLLNSGKDANYILVHLFLILLISFQWFRDIIREAKGGFHTKVVQRGILISFCLFIITEIMLFFSFFWTFFHGSLSPGVEIGAIWPPVGLHFINPWNLPLLGSCLLLSSGFILTLAHHAFIKGSKDITLFNMFWTILIGGCFVILQITEYVMAEFTISDSFFGNIFFMTTGLHGIHVIIGVLFLLISAIRIFFDQFTTEHNLCLEFSIYYYHFVDIIWLYVFVVYYWWSS